MFPLERYFDIMFNLSMSERNTSENNSRYPADANSTGRSPPPSSPHWSAPTPSGTGTNPETRRAENASINIDFLISACKKDSCYYSP